MSLRPFDWDQRRVRSNVPWWSLFSFPLHAGPQFCVGGVQGEGEGTRQWKYEHVPHDRALRAVCKIDELNVVSAIVDVFFAPFILAARLVARIAVESVAAGLR